MRYALINFIDALAYYEVLPENLALELQEYVYDLEGTQSSILARCALSSERLLELDYWEPWMLRIPVDITGLIESVALLSHTNLYLPYNKNFQYPPISDVSSYLAAKALHYVEVENSESGLAINYDVIGRRYCENI